MAIKAFLLDFYGTAVHEDDEAVELICNEIYNTCVSNEDITDISQYWWNEFSALFSHSYGDGFDSKRSLMLQSIEKTVEYFNSTANPTMLAKNMFKLWQRPAIFTDTKKFFEQSPVPICIVSNADIKDIDCAISYHKLEPDLIITSEDARCYKPRSDIFKLALSQLQLDPTEVLHIGDTISSDVVGAFQAGIDVVWLNRKSKPISDLLDPTMVCTSLLDIFKLKYPFGFK